MIYCGEGILNIGQHLVKLRARLRCHLFICAMLASLGVSCRRCVCLSVHPSVTSRCAAETAKCRIMQTTPHDSPDSPGTLVRSTPSRPNNIRGGNVRPSVGTPVRTSVHKNCLISMKFDVCIEVDE